MPEVIDQLLQDAISHHQTGAYQEAECLYRQILAAQPEHPDANHNLGVLAGQHGFWPEALVFFEKACAAYPAQAQFWVSVIKALVQLGKQEEAIVRWREARQQGLVDGRLDEVGRTLGLEPARRPVKPQQSVTTSKSGLTQKDRRKPKESPAISQAEVSHLQGLYQAGDVEGTIRQARLLIKKYPNNGLLWKVLGVMLKLTPAKDEALKALEQAARLLPEDAEAHYNLGNLLRETGQLEEAESAYTKALRLDGQYCPALSNLALTLRELGALHEAEKQARYLLQLDPQSTQALCLLGALSLDEGLYAEAEAYCHKALTIDSNCFDAYNNLGAVLADTDRHIEAIAAFREAHRINPQHAAALGNLGHMLLNQGEWVEAEHRLRQALALDNLLIDAYHNLSNLLYEQDRFDEAEAVLMQALEVKPHHLGTLNNLADLHQVQGNEERARIFYDQGLAAAGGGGVHQLPASPIVTLQPFGRSGSLFFHSLMDGHPQVATLPGVYLKGWFGKEGWVKLKPNLADPRWREKLVEETLTNYEPLFDARSRRNVPGKPMANSNWLARDQGFTRLGPEQDQLFQLDTTKIRPLLLEALGQLPSVSERDWFEILHQAFDRAYRQAVAGDTGNKLIFYHNHNPDTMEMAIFVRAYPEAKFLMIVREPVVSLESWMMNAGWDEADVARIRQTYGAQEVADQEQQFKLNTWKTMAEKATHMLVQLQSPFNRHQDSRGIRLEDVKKNPRQAMAALADWLGVEDHPALYDSSFCGWQYWGPGSRVTGAITGFDTQSIDRKVGKLLGPRDVQVFETFFWPLASLFGYSTLSEQAFRQQLSDIRSWLDEPLEFEQRLYDSLPDQSKPIHELLPYKHLHRTLLMAWRYLEEQGTYGGIPRPLNLDKTE